MITVFPTFSLIQNQAEVKTKSIWSNNEPELSFSDFFYKEGIVSFHFYVDKPQQNLVVEQKHQHILNVARALHFQSHSFR